MEEILNVLISNAATTIATVIGLVFSYYIIPFIKNDIIPWLKEQRITWIVNGFVYGAEQAKASGQLTGLKKDKVIELLESKGIEVTPEVNMIIEACVLNMNMTHETIKKELQE